VIFEHEISFEEFIIGAFHAQSFVGFASGMVMGIDIKAEAANIVAGFCELIDVVVQSSKNALATKFFFDVNALNPPEIPIPPIAPFVGD
jgi:hypothetical protein